MLCFSWQSIYIVFIFCMSLERNESFVISVANKAAGVCLLKKDEEVVPLEGTKTEMMKTMKMGAELKAVLDTLPNKDKYAMLLQSFRNKILQGTNTTFKLASFDVMRSLYSEMITNAYKPDSNCITALVDASSSTQDITRISSACRLIRAGGSMRAFGSFVGQLSAPIFSALNSPMRAVALPVDNRQAEVLHAGVAMSAALLQLGLQGASLFEPDLHPWATLCSSLLLTIAVLDVSLRQGQALRTAAAGVERLILYDKMRQTHSDAASFLAGYLLGLPCFCYKPNVAESVKLLQQHAATLDAFKQPAAMRADKPHFGVRKPQQQRNVLSTAVRQLTGNVPISPGQQKFDADWQQEISNYSQENKRMALGRVLVWLMAPAAAEQLKYGKTVLSDPGLCQRLLDSMDRASNLNTTAASAPMTRVPSDNVAASLTITINAADLPADPADRQALLEWAYFEAVTLVRQHGDVLERVREYMATRTSSVGETALMIDDLLC